MKRHRQRQRQRQLFIAQQTINILCITCVSLRTTKPKRDRKKNQSSKKKNHQETKTEKKQGIAL